VTIKENLKLITKRVIVLDKLFIENCHLKLNILQKFKDAGSGVKERVKTYDRNTKHIV